MYAQSHENSASMKLILSSVLLFVCLLVCLFSAASYVISFFFTFFSTFLYLKFLVVWALVLLADFVLEFRFEWSVGFWSFFTETAEDCDLKKPLREVKVNQK